MKHFLFFLFITYNINLFAQKSNFIYGKESTIHYKTFGKGKPILIINGGPGMNCDGFDKIAIDISKLGFQTIIYDQRGTGKSTLKEVSSTSITIDLMINDIEILRKHLKIKKWSILGQSFGGILATFYAKKHEDKIISIIFSSSAGLNLDFIQYITERINKNLTDVERDSLKFYIQKLEKEPNNSKYLKKRAQFLASAYVVNKEFVSKLAQRLTQVNFFINALIFEDLNKINFNYINQFKDFKQPVLIFQGENDVITTETAQEIHQNFPNSELVLGHL